MKRKPGLEKSPLLAGAAGVIALGLRWAMYTYTMDHKGLVPTASPLALGQWGLAAAVAVMVLLTARSLEKKGPWEMHFPASRLAALGSGCAGAGILLSVLGEFPCIHPPLNNLWRAVGFVAAAALAWHSFCRFKGKSPHVLCAVAVCGFLMLHILGRHQMWSCEPQLLDYVPELLGLMALTLFAYHHGTFGADMGSPGKLWASAMLAVFFCIVSIAGTQYPWLCLGGGLWALTDHGILREKETEKEE